MLMRPDFKEQHHIVDQLILMVLGPKEHDLVIILIDLRHFQAKMSNNFWVQVQFATKKWIGFVGLVG